MPPRKPVSDDDFTDSVFNTIDGDDDLDDNTNPDDDDSGDSDDSGHDESVVNQFTDEDDLDDRNRDPLENIVKQPPARRDQNQRSDSKGNLVDANGKIIAKAGQERRFYAQAQTATREANRLRTSIEQYRAEGTRIIESLQNELRQAQEHSNVFKQSGLSLQDQAQAIDFAKRLQNPSSALGAVKEILTTLQANGVDLKELGVGANSLDIKTLSGMITDQINQNLKPLADSHRESTEQARELNEARQTVQKFFRDNPEAVEHHETLLKIMTQYPQLTITESWLRLENYLLRNEQSNPNERPNGDTGNTNQRQRRRPNGQGRPANRRAINDDPVSVDVSFRDIVRDTVRDYGGIDRD